MKKCYSIAMACTLCVLFTVARLQAQDAGEYLRQASAHFEKKNVPKALTAINKAYQLDSTDLNIILLRGDIYYEAKNLDVALRMADKLIETNLNISYAYFRRGVIMLDLRRPEEALEDLNNALWLAHDSVKHYIYLSRGVAKRKLGDHKGSNDDFMLCYMHDSLNVETLNNLAIAADEIGEGEKTLYYLEKVIAINPKDAFALNNIGFKYQLMGNHKKAIEYFNKTLALLPNLAYTYNNRGFSKFKLGDYDGAMKDITRSLEMDTENSYAYKNKALVLIAQKKTGDACLAIDRALELHFTREFGPEVEELKATHCK